MKLKVSKSFIGGLIMLSIGLLMRTVIPRDIPLSWIMPSIYSWLLIILSIALIIKGLIGWKKNEKDQLILNFSKIKESPEWHSALMICLILAYYLSIGTFGMLVSTVAFVIIAYLFLGVKSWKVILTGTAVCVAVYFIFALGLSVRFPKGLII